MVNVNPGPAALRVLQRVRQRLLHHPVRRHLGAAGGGRRRALPDELDRLPGLPGLVDQGVQVADGGRTRVAGAVIRVEQVEQLPQVADGPAASAGDRGQGLVQLVRGARQVARRLGLHDHRRHVVGDDVVQLPGDARALRRTGGGLDMAAAFRLGGPVLAQPRPDSPRERQQQVEGGEPGDALTGAEPVEETARATYAAEASPATTQRRRSRWALALMSAMASAVPAIVW